MSGGSERTQPLGHVVHLITQLELGGAQQNTLDTVRLLPRSDYRVTLISGAPDRLDGEAHSIRDLEFLSVPALGRPIRPLRDLRALIALTRILRRIRLGSPVPVIVHTHSSKAGILGRWAARLAGIRRVVHTYHGFGFHSDQPAPLRWALIAAERVTRPLTSVFVCVSDANRREGARLRVLAPERCEQIRSGFDLAAFSRERTDPSRLRRELGVVADTPLVGMVACLKPQKAPLDFVRAAQQVSRAVSTARFVLVGDGELRREVDALVRSLGLVPLVHRLGWRHDVPDVLAALDVCVLCSRWEGLPRVIPQALALGVPVVATAVDGTPEAIEDGRTGFLVPPGEPRRLAERVVELLRDDALRRRMGSAGSASVSAFALDTMLHAQERLYWSLLGDSGSLAAPSSRSRSRTTSLPGSSARMRS